MKTLLFGKLSRSPPRMFLRGNPGRPGRAVPTIDTGDLPHDTANGTSLLTPEWDKGNDDKDAIRSSLGLDDKRHQPSE